ncbi:MAG: DUF192 domain-containing protein [Candidatus Pacearchaeota archaeon]
MKRKIKMVVIIIFIFFITSGCHKPAQVCFKDSCFNVELATTPETRARGLMFRESLKDNEGMLFIFPEEKTHIFWMKNTFLSLDIIWIDSNGKVVFISPNAQPCKEEPCPIIIPESPAKYVLEIKAGRAEQIGLNLGDTVTINLPEDIAKNVK